MFWPQDGSEQSVYNGQAHRKCVTIKKVKLSRCKPWKQTEDTEAQFHSFLTLVLDGGEWSAACPSNFAPSEEPPVPNEQEAEWTLNPIWMFLEKKQEENLLVLVLDFLPELCFMYLQCTITKCIYLFYLYYCTDCICNQKISIFECFSVQTRKCGVYISLSYCVNHIHYWSLFAIISLFLFPLFCVMARLLVLGFQCFMEGAQIVIFCILHHVVCFVWSCISEQCTAPIFSVTNLVQMAADVTAREIMHQFYTTTCSPQFVEEHQGYQ
jgi:hypothetical protein